MTVTTTPNPAPERVAAFYAADNMAGATVTESRLVAVPGLPDGGELYRVSLSSTHGAPVVRWVALVNGYLAANRAARKAAVEEAALLARIAPHQFDGSMAEYVRPVDLAAVVWKD